MAENNRLGLHELLCSILGSRNVYFQPPESVKMVYPAIVYELDNFWTTHAGNKPYSSKKRYSVTVIGKDPDNKLVDLLSELPLCRFDRHYKSDNLNHYTFELYY